MTEKQDEELDAIRTIVEALSPLEADARLRVVEYIFKRLGLVSPPPLLGTSPAHGEAAVGPDSSESENRRRLVDIRSLKEEKQPRSSVEMAAIVGYYVSELAPTSERKETISTNDIEHYFKQAKYPLPKAPRMTLPRAASAGYFNVVSRGEYKLNAVGYNLVVHTLPGGQRGEAG